MAVARPPGSAPLARTEAPIARANDAGALGARARAVAPELPLGDSEEVCRTAWASLLVSGAEGPTLCDRLLRPCTGGRTAERGRLYLTQRRLVFIPIGFRAAVATIEISLSGLAQVSLERTFLSRPVHVLLRNGREYRFLVASPASWASCIAAGAGLDEVGGSRA